MHGFPQEHLFLTEEVWAVLITLAPVSLWVWDLNGAERPALHSAEGGDPRSLKGFPRAMQLVSGCCLPCSRLASQTHGQARETAFRFWVSRR